MSHIEKEPTIAHPVEITRVHPAPDSITVESIAIEENASDDITSDNTPHQVLSHEERNRIMFAEQTRRRREFCSPKVASIWHVMSTLGFAIWGACLGALSHTDNEAQGYYAGVGAGIGAGIGLTLGFLFYAIFTEGVPCIKLSACCSTLFNFSQPAEIGHDATEPLLEQLSPV